MSQLEAFVVNGSGAGTGCWVSLPISKGAFLETAATLGLTDPGKDSLFVTDVEPEWEALTPRLQPPYDINELNFFAAKLEEMDDGRRDAFFACLQSERHCGCVPEMINLVENLGCVDLQPAFTPEEYGAFQLSIAQDEYAETMDALENSESPLEGGFYNYISDLETCLDIKNYGRLIAHRENGAFTDYGYLTESAAFQEVYRGAQDIPAEFQVSPFQDAQPLLRLEHTDLTDVLTKMHDLGGHTSDLDRNLETLHRRRSANFLLLFTEDKAFLSESMHVYRKGTAAHDAFVNAAEAKMFSIYVTDFQTDFIGDIREVDASARRADILDNSIHFVDVRAVTLDGESLTFTPEEWKNVSAAERDSFQSWARQFADGDFTKVNRHVEQQGDADDSWARSASLEQFFSKLERDSPVKAERVPEPRPKSVLAQIAAARTQRNPVLPNSAPEKPNSRGEER